MRILTESGLELPKTSIDIFKETHSSYEKIKRKSYLRESLVAELHQYNALIGNDAAAFKNIDALAHSDSVCIITGQQLGFMGGAAYTILKGLSCLLVARAAGAVPIFWLATEDHDIAEIDHACLLDSLGNLQRFQLSFPKDDRSVEDLRLHPKNIEVIHSFLNAVHLSENQWLNSVESYSQTMAQMLARLFAGTGMVFIEPRFLRKMPITRQFFQKEIEKSREILQILQSASERLAANGEVPILTFRENATNLFLKIKGIRCKLFRKENGFVAGGRFFSQAELLSFLDNEPELFSPNVAARPVLQNLLFPVLAYIGGPTEIAYHRQLIEYHDFHNASMPSILPRHSITFIPAYANEILEKCGLHPWNAIPHHWASALPSLRAGLDNIERAWKKAVMDELNKKFPEDAFFRFAIGKLERKIIRLRLRKQKIPSYGLHLLRNLLHPHEKMQERVLNWWSFQSHTEENILLELFKRLSWKPEGHLYCTLF